VLRGVKYHMTPLDSVAFMLIKGDRVLVEKRKATKQAYPGAIALPGGHVEDGESPEEALCRESKEELGVVPRRIKYVCTLLYRLQELQRIHYFAIEAWEGNIENNEAESLLWVPITRSQEFDIDVDRIALSEYLRVYAS
jgi:8-oxo-dGTP diphosphatase